MYVKTLSHSGETLLRRAVLSDNIDIVKYLVNEKHMDVNERNDQMKTPLHIAATHNSDSIYKFLLNETANLVQFHFIFMGHH